MGKILAVVFVVCMLVFIVSGRMKSRLPAESLMLPELQYEPVQQEGVPDSFVVRKEKSEFTITPKAAYEIRGMIVTLHKSKSISDSSHAQWGDFLNVEDICVLWGGNLRQSLYGKVSFSSGDWTCFFQTKEMDVYRAFDLSKISNNHILTNDPVIEKAVLAADIGDQIYMKGYLVNYSKANGFERKTSMTRADTGQGACEILYLTDFKILKKANPGWRAANTASKIGTIGCIVLLVVYAVLTVISASREKEDEVDVEYPQEEQKNNPINR